MPQNAIDNVAIDYVVPIEGTAEKLIELTRREPNRAEPVKVLIVEDEQVVAENLEQRLRELGYQLSGSVTSGEEAVDLAAERQPDVVLMDIHLAGRMSGIEAARRIWEQFPNTHCVCNRVRRSRQIGGSKDNGKLWLHREAIPYTSLPRGPGDCARSP